MKKTFKEWREFNIVAQNYLARTNGVDTKLSYAIGRIQNRDLKSAFTEYKDAVRDIEIDHCFTDANGVIVYDEGKDQNGRATREFRFTKDELKARDKALKELMKVYDKKELEVTPHIVEVKFPILSDLEIEIFRGVVISEDYETPVLEERPKMEKVN